MEYDFLSVQRSQVSHVDLIIMNPPFSNAVHHINHAWDIAPEGCEIIALCNWETIDNRRTRPRIILNSTIKKNGTAENLGDVFTQAERKTGVNVGLIKLFKPFTGSDNADRFSGFYMDEEPEYENAPGIMQYNQVRDIVQRYIGTVQAFEKLQQAATVVNDYITPLGLSKGFSYSVGYNNQVTTVEAFAKELQKKSWVWIIEKTGVKKYVTSKVLEDINKFVETQSQYPFTMKNIYRMLETIIKTRSQTMDRAVIDVFDKITLHHHDNRHNVEGWKTNKNYLVGEKFILDYITEFRYGGGLGIRYNGNQSKLNDMTKVLKYLTANTENIQELDHFARAEYYDYVNSEGQKVTGLRDRTERLEFGKWYSWGFFEIKGFKKGTMHFKFKNRDHWALFNKKVAEIKGFVLPESI